MQKIIIQCKMNGHLTELPCSASGCPLFGDCYARYEEYTKNHQADTKGDQMMKPKITIYLKCGILMFMVAAGFLLTYTYAWFWLALPETWWAAALLAVLSGLSTFGLIRWIGKEDHVPVRCGRQRNRS